MVGPMWQPSPNFNARPAKIPIDMLVLHYTGMQNADAALTRLNDLSSEVSAHYLIDEHGRVFQLVQEGDRAWHAGAAAWRGNTNINSRSIGIELVNPGHEHGYRPFPAEQMAALADLAEGIIDRWPIPPRNIVGHSDVAPGRKQDPGELFDWRWLAERGIGLWPESRVPVGDAADRLRAFGYGLDDLADLPAVVTAFQRHFRPTRCDGRLDDETNALLQGLVDLL